MKASRVMKARGTTRCALCRGWITRGQQIGKVAVFGWCHTSCITREPGARRATLRQLEHLMRQRGTLGIVAEPPSLHQMARQHQPRCPARACPIRYATGDDRPCPDHAGDQAAVYDTTKTFDPASARPR